MKLVIRCDACDDEMEIDLSSLTSAPPPAADDREAVTVREAAADVMDEMMAEVMQGELG